MGVTWENMYTMLLQTHRNFIGRWYLCPSDRNNSQIRTRLFLLIVSPHPPPSHPPTQPPTQPPTHLLHTHTHHLATLGAHGMRESGRCRDDSASTRLPPAWPVGPDPTFVNIIYGRGKLAWSTIHPLKELLSRGHPIGEYHYNYHT